MPDEFEALAFPARERIHRLAESQIAEAGLLQELKCGRGAPGRLARAKRDQKLNCFIHGGIQEVGNAPWLGGALRPRRIKFDFEDMRTITTAVAFGAADVDIAQKLHFNFLETGSAASFALAFGGIETERPRAEPALTGEV